MKKNETQECACSSSTEAACACVAEEKAVCDCAPAGDRDEPLPSFQPSCCGSAR